MRFLLIMVLGAIMMLPLQAQKDWTAEKRPALFRPIQSNGAVIEFGYANAQVRANTLHGHTLTFGAEFFNRWTLGINWETTYSSTLSLPLPTGIFVINPIYRYNTYSLLNEFSLFPNSVFNISIPLKTGVGHVTYNERYVLVGNNGTSNAQIAQDAFLMLEPGIKVHLQLFEYIGLFGGASYRIPFGVGKAGSDSDFQYAAFQAGLRFGLPWR